MELFNLHLKSAKELISKLKKYYPIRIHETKDEKCTVSVVSRILANQN